MIQLVPIVNMTVIDDSARTDSEHDCVRQLDVVDADPGDEANQAWNDVRVIHVYRLCNRLEPIQ